MSPPHEAPLFQTHDLVVGYQGQGLLPPITMEIHAESFWCLIGRNGSGKTTLLRTLLGLLRPVSGHIEGFGSGVAYVPQRHSLEATTPMRVVDVVRDGLDVGWSFLNPFHRWTLRNVVGETLKELNVHTIARASFHELSEGQKQRVLLARALVSNPRVILLDEPTSAMDLIAERETLETLAALRARRSVAVLVVSHHLQAVAPFATDVLFLNREGNEVTVGSLADVTARPSFQARYGDLRHLVAASHNTTEAPST